MCRRISQSALTQAFWGCRAVQNTSLFQLSDVRKCHVSKHSVVMVTHELAEINLCLRSLGGAPHSTNQSHQANGLFIRLTHTQHLALQSAVARNSGWCPSGGQGFILFAYSLFCLCVLRRYRKLSPGCVVGSG